jgi:4'-phosphopantetheinyl transferase
MVGGLRADAVHVWLVRPQAVRSAAEITACRVLLDGEERARLARFRFRHHAHDYLVAHAFLRVVLSHYEPLEPAAWSFARNRYGRPEIMRAAGALPLRFNLSHTEGLVACAVVLESDLGIDVEPLDRSPTLDAIAERWFSDAERAALAALPSHRRRERSVELWVLKEAYAKAKGLGLTLPLERMSFDVRGTTSGDITLAPPDEEAGSWQFALLEPTPDHRGAVAVNRGPANVDRSVVLREAPPGFAVDRWWASW